MLQHVDEPSLSKLDNDWKPENLRTVQGLTGALAVGPLKRIFTNGCLSAVSE